MNPFAKIAAALSIPFVTACTTLPSPTETSDCSVKPDGTTVVTTTHTNNFSSALLGGVAQTLGNKTGVKDAGITAGKVVKIAAQPSSPACGK